MTIAAATTAGNLVRWIILGSLVQKLVGLESLGIGLTGSVSPLSITLAPLGFCLRFQSVRVVDSELSPSVLFRCSFSSSGRRIGLPPLASD